MTRQVRDFSKRILGVITVFTRQWPHSVPFRPGGATCPVGADDIRCARAAVDDYAAWYAPTFLGGPFDQWAEVATARQLGCVVMLDFNGIHWPHVTVGTLVKQ